MEKFEDKILYNQDSKSARTGMSPGRNRYQAALHNDVSKSLELLVKGRERHRKVIELFQMFPKTEVHHLKAFCKQMK